VLWWVVLLATGLSAVLLSVARALDPVSSRLVLAESFTPLALPAYAVVLLLALGALLRRRPRRGPERPARAGGPGVAVTALALLAGLAAAGVVLHAAWFSARVSGANPPPAEGAEPLTVLQANVLLGEADGIELVRTASEEGADLLVVEEITGGVLTQMERAGLAELFPYRVGVPRDTDPGGTMVFSRTRLGPAAPIGTRYDGWRVEVDGLTLVAVHPDSPLDLAGWRADHAAILAAVRASDADLVVGDFNATLDHRPMRELAAAGRRSVAELANEGWQPTWPEAGRVGVLGLPVPPVVQIDHVLVGPRLAALGTHTVDLHGSDHRGLVATVART
jgi:endonuclease/exonuclease/phosphatase (EEP) superfamily protein YafD